MRSWLLLIVAIGLLLAGCTGSAQAGAQATNTTANASASVNVSAPPAQNVSNASAAANATADPIVEFDTTQGNFTAVIYVNEAPITGGNFMKLVNMGFYNGLTFHRVVPNFVVQGGDPKGDGTGGANWTIPLEIVPGLTHQLGTLAMARANDPNSASSQFYVVIGPASFLDGQYAVFGRVTGPDQMAVVERLQVGDKMLKVYQVQN